jgi:S-formylglutathione hydrolase FrmB
MNPATHKCGILRLTTAGVLFLLLGFVLWHAGSHAARTRHGIVERVKVHGASLERNLEGNSPDRDVSIYLPASYAGPPEKRYPVIYLLHGFTANDRTWFHDGADSLGLAEIADRAFSTGHAQEMIIVAPNAHTRLQGSFYSNSITTGNWEDFVATELVTFVDTHYRTLAKVESRGIAGHSMGGYGAMRIAIKHPTAFSSVYALNAISLGWPDFDRPLGSVTDSVLAVHSFQDFDNASFLARVSIAQAAAWSPNSRNSPLFFDLPVTPDARPRTDIVTKWAVNSPIVQLDQYRANLLKLRAIAFDAGNDDIPAVMSGEDEFHKALSLEGIPHSYETYRGNHINRLKERLEKKVLPFFSTNLAF